MSDWLHRVTTYLNLPLFLALLSVATFPLSWVPIRVTFLLTCVTILLRCVTVFRTVTEAGFLVMGLCKRIPFLEDSTNLSVYFIFFVILANRVREAPVASTMPLHLGATTLYDSSSNTLLHFPPAS